MFTKEINQTKESLYKLIEEKNLISTFEEIDTLLELGISPYISQRLESIKTTYSYMGQYMLQGVEDPQREKLYNDILNSLYEITDLVIDELMIREDNSYIYDKRRYYQSIGGVNIDEKLCVLKRYIDKYNLIKESASNEQIINYLKKIEAIQDEIFAIIATLFTTTEEEERVIKQLLYDDEFGQTTSSLVISALTLSSIYFYSEKKLLLLLDTYAISNNEQIKQRALCGALIIMYIYSKRVKLSKTIEDRVNLFSDEYNFCKDVRQQFFQFIRSLETEKISKIFTQELIPELLKLSPNLSKNISLDDISEENLNSLYEKNPNWEKILDDKGLTKKFEEINEMQIEGSDVMLTTFASLKSYPFFNNITSWLRPFTINTSVIYSAFHNDGFEYGDMFEKSDFLCNSDKYSFALTFAQMPKGKEGVALNSPEQFIADTYKEDITQIRDISKSISTLYIQDLYRLFNLSKFKLPNIFEHHIDLFEVEVLKPIFNDEETLRLIGEFYIKKEYYSFAEKYFKALISHNFCDAELYQKLGYCKQLQKDYEGAIEEYIKADNISEDLWTINQLALCYRAIGNYNKAIECYNDALRIKPDSLRLELQLGNCLLNEEKYDLALKHLYKVDFLTDGSIKTWRPIAWCSLMLGKIEDAVSYYNKTISETPIFKDYINLGHAYLVKGNIKEAYNNYIKGAEINPKSITYFKSAFSSDSAFLIGLGVPESTIAIIKDIVISNIRKN